MSRGITKLEMLLAIAMSEFYQKTHVLFLPPNTSYRGMLKTLVTKKYIEPKSLNYYKCTAKGNRYIQNNRKKEFSAADNAIDRFVDSL